MSTDDEPDYEDLERILDRIEKNTAPRYPIAASRQHALGEIIVICLIVAACFAGGTWIALILERMAR